MLGLGSPGTMFAPRLRKDEGQPPSGLRDSGCSSPGRHFGVWRRELDPDRAPKRALWSAPLSPKLYGRPGPKVPGSFLRGLLLSRAGAQGPAQNPGREAKGLPPPKPRLS